MSLRKSGQPEGRIESVRPDVHEGPAARGFALQPPLSRQCRVLGLPACTHKRHLAHAAGSHVLA